MRVLAISCLIWTCQAVGRPETAVSVVASLSGTASIDGKARLPARKLELFAWIPAGSTVSVGTGSSLILVFGNGSRFEMRDGARATVTPDGLKNISGIIRELSRVPVLPKLASIEDTEKTAITAGAVRLVRGNSIDDLYPRARARSLPDETTLRFSPIVGAVDYTIVIQDHDGGAVLKVRATSSIVLVPPGVLKPESQYHWHVRANVIIGPSHTGQADFSTLTSTEIDRRLVWQALLANAEDPDLITLAAELDRQLGLLFEAREKLLTAIKIWPNETKVRSQLAKVNEDLALEP